MDHPVVSVDPNANEPHLALESDMDVDMDNEIQNSDCDSDTEVETQTVHNNESVLPEAPPMSISPSLPPSRASNRRARLEDDGDDDRDRRHPSQRVAQTPNNPSSSTSSVLDAHLPQTPASIPRSASAPQVHPQRQPPNIQHSVFHAMFNMAGRNDQPFRFFQHMLSNDPGNPPNNNIDVEAHDNNPIPAAPPPPNVPTPLEPQQNGNAASRPPTFALSFLLGQPGLTGLQRQPRQPPPPPPQAGADGTDSGPNQQTQANPDQTPHPNDTLSDLLHRLRETMGPINFGFGTFGPGLDAEREDPDRARKLVDGLDEVPIGLVRRLVRVGGTGGGMGHDETRGGDAGCAICWDTLLDSEGTGFGKSDGSSPEASVLAEKSSYSSNDSESKQAKIVTLPCAHIFHADCLIPWFSRPRHTTCPTCRFNIDPDNLTYVSWRTRQRQREEAERGTSTESTPETAEQPANSETGANNPFDQGIHNDFLNFPIPWILRPSTTQTTGETNAPTPAPTTTATPSGEAQTRRPTGLPPAAGSRRHATTTYRTANGLISITQFLPIIDLDVTEAGPAPRAEQVQAPGQGQQFGELPSGATSPPRPGPPQPQPHTAANQPQQQQTGDFLANLDATARAIATDRAIVDVLSRLFGGNLEQPPQPAGQPPAEGQEDEPQAPPPAQSQRQRPQQPPTANPQATNGTHGQPPPFRMFANLSGLFGDLQERDDGPKPPWTLPPAPGPTLRQRIEHREREAGLRCYDVSCGVGPSDEDPELSDTILGMKQMPIMEKNGVGNEICLHRFHGSCLVSATRVALKGMDTAVEDGNVEVSCPVCRGVGCVPKEEWDAGVAALQ